MKKPIILCVDDERMVLTSLKSQLKRHLGTDFSIETVESGDEAIEVFKELKEEGYDVPLVISDQIMPGMKGDEFLAQIHILSENSIKILLTGQASAEAVGNAVNNAQLYRYIQKPWEIADLNMTVSQAISSFFQSQELEQKNKELKETLEGLEEKIIERTTEIESQKKKLEEKNKDITDSINYAKLIQDSILPKTEELKSILPNSFVVFLPKDIVSGDFYWFNFNEARDRFYFSVADSTGHGVPGAFMSLIGSSLFNESVKTKEFITPDKVLQKVKQGIIKTLKQKDDSQKDGMDASLINFDLKTKELCFSGAFNPLYIIRGNNNPLLSKEGERIEPDMISEEKHLYVIKGDKQPLAFHRGIEEDFTLHQFQMETDDEIFMFSDGYPDQFGGEKNKKFRYNRFKELLVSVFGKDSQVQKKEVTDMFDSWKKDLEQIDDVCVFGARF